MVPLGAAGIVAAISLASLRVFGFDHEIFEILRLEHLANLDLRFSRHGIGAALDPINRLLQRLALPEPEARDQLLRFGERAVSYRARRAGKPDAHAFGTRVKAVGGQHDTGLYQFFVEFAHLG